MTDRDANQSDGFRIRDYLQIATRKARLRETLRLSAAVCEQKLSVEEAYKLHGLKLDDVLRYLAHSGYLRSPPEAMEQEPETPAPPALGLRVNEVA